MNVGGSQNSAHNTGLEYTWEGEGGKEPPGGEILFLLEQPHAITGTGSECLRLHSPQSNTLGGVPQGLHRVVSPGTLLPVHHRGW